MTATRPGLDRQQRQRLQAAAIRAEGDMRLHLKACQRCDRAGTNVRARCSHWWKLARIAHQSRRALKAWQQPETTSMDTLPGIGAP